MRLTVTPTMMKAQAQRYERRQPAVRRRPRRVLPLRLPALVRRQRATEPEPEQLARELPKL